MYSKLQNILCVAALTYAAAANAQVPSMIGYQGRVSANGSNFNGTGLFKFALVNGGTQNSGVRATATASVVSGFVVGYTIVNGRVVVREGRLVTPALALPQ